MQKAINFVKDGSLSNISENDKEMILREFKKRIIEVPENEAITNKFHGLDDKDEMIHVFFTNKEVWEKHD